MEMDVNPLKAALLEKMNGEQDTYRVWLLKQTPEEILNHTYEFTVRQDIIAALDAAEEETLSNKHLEALLSSPAPLNEVYRDFCKLDVDASQTFCECMCNLAEEQLTRKQEEQNLSSNQGSGKDKKEREKREQPRKASIKAQLAANLPSSDKTVSRHKGKDRGER